ncbi:DNA-methyltransferase [Clostridium haemolyticum]|uniref:Methyltransferase n=1 Tax=Clostridium haemolyticum NCTC 9693 TaxID=1443114 RepID=A0ABR4TC17_CLOHA|nr:site-specific DNA-methyltransferase [Clostridium haemolyticum]KEI14105.1 adenine-specific DNA methyltransferase [Clostridium haemolyticum NCTC 9693]
MNRKGTIAIDNITNLKNKIFNEDCFETLKRIPDKSINLIIYDAPYFSTKKEEVGDKKWKNEDEYINWCIKLIKETQRVLKDNGSFYWFHNDINIMVEILYRTKHETNFKLKNQITWDKLATGNQDFLMPLYKNSKLKRRYGTSLAEYIYYFTFDDSTGLVRVYDSSENFKDIKNYLKQERKKVKEKKYSDKDLRAMCGLSLKGGGLLSHYWGNKQWVFPIEKHYKKLQSTGCFQRSYDILKEEYKALKIQYEDTRQKYELERYKFNQPYLTTPKNLEESRNTIRPYSSVWHYKRDNNIYETHLTPKPLEMIKHIINVSSNKGDTVLDCFMGSGTTAIACLETGRNYIGCEVDQDYYTVIEKRINTYLEEKDKNIF